MILSNVNIGTGPSSGDGDPLRNAFTTINNNFQKITNNVNALTNSVTTVAGRTGNIVLTVNDVIGAASVAYVNSQLGNAGSYSNVNVTAFLPGYSGNIAAVITANTAMKGYVDASIAGLVDSAPGTLDTLNELADALGNDPNLSVTLTNTINSANTNMKAYVDGQITAANTLAYSNVNTLSYLTTYSYATQNYVNLANTSLKNYVDGQITAANTFSNYGNAQVATYLASYGGNVAVGNIIFDDLSVQTTAYTGTQWRSNLSSNVTVKPSWLSYVPGGKNQEGTQYGFDASGMFFRGNADNDFAYPIQTNLHFHEQDVLEVIATIYFGATNNDHGLSIFSADARPIWRGSTDTTRIAFQYSAGIPLLYGQTTANTAPGSPVLSTGNYYTIKFKYDPSNTVIVETFSGNTATGSPIDTRSLSEVLPAGDYRLGFDADNDAAGVKSYWTNLTVRTLTNTVVNDLDIQGQVTGNLIPQSNVTQSLGNVTHQWKDLWVSNNTIYINSIPLSIDNGGNLLINGAPVSVGTATGITSNDDIFITNSIGGANVADIRIESADDIILQAKDRLPGFSSEGGDINIYAGDGADDDGAVGSGNAGDIQIFAGNGGAAGTYDSGGSGGFVSIRGGVGGAASATYNADNGGDVTITAGDAGDNDGDTSRGNFGGDIRLQAGATTLEDENGGSINLTTAAGGVGNAQSGEVRITIPATGAFLGGEWVFSGTGRTLSTPQNAEIFGAGAGNLTIGSAGNTFIRSVNYSTLTPYTWQFSDVGTLSLPGNIVNGNSGINFVASSSGDGNGFSTIELRPDDVNTSMDNYLIIDPTSPNHIHIRAGGAQDNSQAELYLGGENSYFVVNDGLNPLVAISANSYVWEYNTNGTITFPDSTVQTTAWTGNVANLTNGTETVSLDQYGILYLPEASAIYAKPDNSLELRVTATGNVSHKVEQVVRDGSEAVLSLTQLDQTEFTIWTNSLSYQWTFSNTGTLTFPDSTVQSTAWTGFANIVNTGSNIKVSVQNSETVTYTAGADYTNLSEITGGLIFFYSPTVPFLATLQALNGTETFQYTSYGPTYTTTLTSPFTFNAGLSRWEASAVNTGGSYVDSIILTAQSEKNWNFTPAGNLVFPDSTVQTTAFSNSAVSTYLSNYDGSITFTASPAIISGVGIISTLTANVSGNVNAGNVNANNSVRLGTGNARVTSNNTSLYLIPDTSADALAGVTIGGNGYLLGPNNARNITLNYNGVGGAVGLQGNVTVGTAATSILTVNGNVTANNISATGNILSSGVTGKIGYSAGGYAIQSGNSSGITLNSISGNIQLDTVNIAMNTTHTVALTNNKLDANDIILVQGQDSSALDLHIGSYYLTTNTAIIYLRNISGSSIGPIAPMLKFIIVKAPSS